MKQMREECRPLIRIVRTRRTAFGQPTIQLRARLSRRKRGLILPVSFHSPRARTYAYTVYMYARTYTHMSALSLRHRPLSARWRQASAGAGEFYARVNKNKTYTHSEYRGRERWSTFCACVRRWRGFKARAAPLLLRCIYISVCVARRVSARGAGEWAKRVARAVPVSLAPVYFLFKIPRFLRAAATASRTFTASEIARSTFEC